MRNTLLLLLCCVSLSTCEDYLEYYHNALPFADRGDKAPEGYHPSPPKCHPETITKYKTVYKDRKADVVNQVEIQDPHPKVHKVTETRYTTIRYPVFITQVIKPLLTQVETKIKPVFFTKTVNKYTTVHYTVTGIGQVTETKVKYEKEYITRCMKKGYGKREESEGILIEAYAPVVGSLLETSKAPLYLPLHDDVAPHSVDEHLKVLAVDEGGLIPEGIPLPHGGSSYKEQDRHPGYSVPIPSRAPSTVQRPLPPPGVPYRTSLTRGVPKDSRRRPPFYARIPQRRPTRRTSLSSRSPRNPLPMDALYDSLNHQNPDIRRRRETTASFQELTESETSGVEPDSSPTGPHPPLPTVPQKLVS